MVFLENEMLYGHEFDVPEGDDWVVPIGKAKIRRRGKDVTLTAHSRMVGAGSGSGRTAGQGRHRGAR